MIDVLPSGNKFQAVQLGGIKALADAIKNNGAMVKFDISKNMLFAPGTKVLAEALNGNQVLTELNISGNYMGYGSNDISDVDMSGVIAIGDAIPTMGALVSANLLNNKIGVEQAQNLATIFKEHASLKSLCGNKGDETELDMSGKKMGADGAIMLAPEIVANGALTSLDISKCMLTGKYGGDMSGIEALAAAIPECK